jgi:hypothetical protein
MTEQAAQSSPPRSLADQLKGRNLLAALEDLGDRLTGGELPNDLRKIVGGLVHLVETGSIEPPAPPATRDEVRQLNETEADNARLQSEVATLQAQMAEIVAAQAQAQVNPPAPPEGTAPPAADQTQPPYPPAPPAGGVLPPAGTAPGAEPPAPAVSA